LVLQNNLSPFSNSTTINYSLPVKFSSAKIIITDKNGNALKRITLSNNKLYVDGKIDCFKADDFIKIKTSFTKHPDRFIAMFSRCNSVLYEC
jgi:uncharacterized Zn ribbon protein